MKREEDRGSSREILQLLEKELNKNNLPATNQRSHISK